MADLSGIVFAHHDLSRRILSGLCLARCSFVMCDLECARIAGCDLTDAKFDGANLHGAILAGSKVTGASFVGCRGMDTVNLSGAYIGEGEPPTGWAKDKDQRLYRRDRR